MFSAIARAGLTRSLCRWPRVRFPGIPASFPRQIRPSEADPTLPPPQEDHSVTCSSSVPPGFCRVFPAKVLTRFFRAFPSLHHRLGFSCTSERRRLSPLSPSRKEWLAVKTVVLVGRRSPLASPSDSLFHCFPRELTRRKRLPSKEASLTTQLKLDEVGLFPGEIPASPAPQPPSIGSRVHPRGSYTTFHPSAEPQAVIFDPESDRFFDPDFHAGRSAFTHRRHFSPRNQPRNGSQLKAEETTSK